MRFDKETRKQIHDAKGAEVTIRWPTGVGEPLKGCTYRVQALEDREKAEHRLKASPPTHRDAMAEMHKRYYGSYPKGYEPPKPKLPRPSKEDPCIEVVSVIILKRGWEAVVVALEDDPDPVRHTGVRAKVAGAYNPLATVQGEAAELEPEQLVARRSRSEREDSEDALRIEHEASVDRTKVAEIERTLASRTRKGRGGKFQEQALERARRRDALATAGADA